MPDPEGADSFLGFAASLRRDPRRAAYATVREASGRFAAELERHLWRDLQGSFGTEIGDEVLRQSIDDQLLDAIVTDHGGAHGGDAVVEGELEQGADAARWTIEVLEPPPRLWIFGAGEDMVPLVGQSRALGWEVVVIASHLLDEHRRRFAQFDSVRVIEMPPREAAVQLALRLLPERRPEVAVLSSRDLPAEAEYLRGLEPLGLPCVIRVDPPGRSETGAETGPEDVARSVVAQIQARLRPALGQGE